MAGLASDVRDEADATGIVLEAWVVEGADCARWEVASHPDTFFPAFEMRSSLPGETKTSTAWPHLAQAVDVVVLRCPATAETTRIVRSPASTDKSPRSLVPILCRHGGDRAGARSPHARSLSTGGAIGVGASSVPSRIRGERGVVGARAGRRADVVALRRRVALHLDVDHRRGPGWGLDRQLRGREVRRSGREPQAARRAVPGRRSAVARDDPAGRRPRRLGAGPSAATSGPDLRAHHPHLPAAEPCARYGPADRDQVRTAGGGPHRPRGRP